MHRYHWLFYTVIFDISTTYKVQDKSVGFIDFSSSKWILGKFNF